MRNKRFILSALLAGYLVATSCTETRDPSKDIVYSFKPEVIFPSIVTSGKKSLLSIRLDSDVYHHAVLTHEVTYEDDKKSYLLSPKGNIIRPNEPFDISDKSILSSFDFYSEDLGEHNLKFTFKNSKGFTVTEERKVVVKNGTFKLSVKKSSYYVMVTYPLEIGYSYEVYDQLKHSYKLKFEVDGNHKSTLNGHKAGEWFNISKLSGKLSYLPLSTGTHNVKLISKNESGIEKEITFSVESGKSGAPKIKDLFISKFHVYRSYEDYIGGSDFTGSYLDFSGSFSVDTTGDNTPYVKGYIIIPSMDIKQSFELDKKKYNWKVEKGSNFEPSKGEPMEYIIVLTNSTGTSTEIRKTSVPTISDDVTEV